VLIDWLPQALKRIYRFAGKSSVGAARRRNQPARRLGLTLQVETLEERQMLSAVNGFDNIDPALLSLAGVSTNTDITTSQNVSISSLTAASTNSNGGGSTGTPGSSTATLNTSQDTWIARDSAGRVGVHITATNPTALQGILQTYGMTLTGVQQSLHFLEGFINASSIPMLSSLSSQGLLGVTPIYKPFTKAGPTPDPATGVLQSDRVNGVLPTGYDGTGVRVGILSDSFNAGGAANLAAYTTGDLPKTVTVLKEGPADGTNEGRAMAELVHDVAPGASIAFATAEGGEAAFAQSIRDLANPTKGNSSIIVDDVGYFAEPMFQDGVIAQAINDVVKYNGVAYFSAAGNSAADSYETSSPTFGADTNGQLPGTFLKFTDANGNTSTRNSITMFPSDTLALDMQWDNPFYTTNGVKTDLDILYVDASTGAIIYQTSSNNIASQIPNEFGGFNGFFGQVDVMVRLDAGPAPGRIKWLDIGSHFDTFQFQTNSGTVVGHAASNSAMAVAASPYYDATNVESFSSLGGTTILFTPTGAPLGTPDVRQTPDITSIDGANTSFFTTGDIEGDGSPNFFGTSAAAPHAAAVAALIRQANPGYTPQQVYDRLTSTATDIGAPGVDNQTGYGLINAWKAIYGDPTAGSLNLSDSFEAGSLSDHWEVNTLGSGQVAVNASSGAADGSDSMTLQSSLAGIDPNNFAVNPTFYIARNIQSTAFGFGEFAIGSLSESILHMDLSNATDDVYLSFSAKQSYDPLILSSQTAPGTSNNLQEPMSSVFTDREGSDGVAISTDGGTTWYRVVSLTGNVIGRDFQNHSFNLTEFANQHGINLGSDVRIKFQQFDSLGIGFDNFNGSVQTFFFPTTTGSLNGPQAVRTNAITIDDVHVFSNLGPTVTVNPLALTYNTGAPAIKIDAAAAVTDQETPIFDGGQLTVAISGNGTLQDRLGINNEGNLSGQISTSGNRILYGGLEIGTYVGGSANAPLVVTLNGNATPGMTQRLLQNVTFQTTSASLLQRTVDVTVTDGKGGSSGTQSRKISILPGVNIAPTITLTPAALTVQPGATAVSIDANATVTDPDSLNFANGVLTFKISANTSSYDRLEIRNQGNAPTQIGFSGSTIKYGGTTIGTLTGGSTDRTVTLNASATVAAVQALLQNITFRTTSTSAPVAARSVQFKLTDGDGGTSAIATKVVNVAKKNQAPVLTGSTSTPKFTLGSTATVINSSASVTDSDSVNFAGGVLTVRITANGTPNDRLAIKSQGQNIGQIAINGGTNVLYGGILIGTVSGGNGSTSPLKITLNANATAAAVRALMRSITFQTTSSTVTSLKNRTVTFQLTDGQSGTSNTMTNFVAVSNKK
jgi:hypothetical protein